MFLQVYLNPMYQEYAFWIVGCCFMLVLVVITMSFTLSLLVKTFSLTWIPNNYSLSPLQVENIYQKSSACAQEEIKAYLEGGHESPLVLRRTEIFELTCRSKKNKQAPNLTRMEQAKTQSQQALEKINNLQSL